QQFAAGQVRVQVRPIGNVADERLRLERAAHDVVSTDADGAGGRHELAGYGPYRRRLAGPVGPQQRQDPTARHAEREAVNGRETSVALDKSIHLDHGHRLRGPRAWAVWESRHSR